MQPAASHIYLDCATPFTAVEARDAIDRALLREPAVATVLHTRQWTSNVMQAESIFGSGTITVHDHQIIIDIELSILGKAARTKIISTLEQLITASIAAP